MRKLSLMFIAAAVLAGASGRAASPEDAYWTARNADIAKVAKLEAADPQSDKADKAGAQLLLDLQKRLKAIVGPVSVKGFPSEGKINLQTLGSEIGSGMLDGLLYQKTADGQTPSLVVTTRGLLQRWLDERGKEADATLRVPTKIEEALQSDAFYEFGVGSDAAFTNGGALDIVKPDGADFAFATIGRWSQEQGPSELGDIFVSVVKGDRVLVAGLPAKPKIPELAACKPIWDAASAKSDKLSKAYQDGGAKDEKLMDESNAVSGQGEKDWFACMRAHLKEQKEYAALVGQAQEVAGRLAGK